MSLELVVQFQCTTTGTLASHLNFLVCLSLTSPPPQPYHARYHFALIYSALIVLPLKETAENDSPPRFPLGFELGCWSRFHHILRLVKLLDLYLFPNETPHPLCRFTMTSCVRLSSSLFCWFVSAQQKLPRGEGNQQRCARSCKTVSNNRKLINRENPPSSINMQQATRWGETRCV